MRKYRMWLTVKKSESMGLLEFKYLNANGDEIEL